MDSLPYELLKMIVDGVPDCKDLCQIRMVNKTFCALATPRVFQRYSVYGTAESATAINEITRRETLAQCIKQINFSPQLSYGLGSEFHYIVSASRGRLNVLLSAWQRRAVGRAGACHRHFFVSPQACGTQDFESVALPAIFYSGPFIS